MFAHIHTHAHTHGRKRTFPRKQRIYKEQTKKKDKKKGCFLLIYVTQKEIHSPRMVKQSKYRFYYKAEKAIIIKITTPQTMISQVITQTEALVLQHL